MGRPLAAAPGLQEVAQAALDKTLDHSVDHIMQQVALWQGGGPFEDDLSILAIEISP